MNSTFQKAAAFLSGPPPVLNHKQRITRMYKSILQNVEYWTMNRKLFIEEAVRIRAEFDKYKNLSADSGIVQRVIRETEEKLQKLKHPDPYVLQWMPGGTKFMRNPSIQLKRCYPDGVPEEEKHIFPAPAINVDMTPLPAKKYLLVDFATKSYKCC